MSLLAVCLLLLAITSPQQMLAAELAFSAVFVLFFGIISYNLILGYKAHVFGFSRCRRVSFERTTSAISVVFLCEQALMDV